MLGWHFVGETLRDGRPVPVDGEWLVHERSIEPCKTGLHMSECPFDALQYAMECTLCRVELDGEIVGHGNPIDKHVGRRRRILARIDATHLLRRFAADQALIVAHLWDMPAIMREYLETLDESKRATARAAAKRKELQELQALHAKVKAMRVDSLMGAAKDASAAWAWSSAMALEKASAIDAAKYASLASSRALARTSSSALAMEEFVNRVHLAFRIEE